MKSYLALLLMLITAACGGSNEIKQYNLSTNCTFLGSPEKAPNWVCDPDIIEEAKFSELIILQQGESITDTLFYEAQESFLQVTSVYIRLRVHEYLKEIGQSHEFAEVVYENIEKEMQKQPSPIPVIHSKVTSLFDRTYLLFIVDKEQYDFYIKSVLCCIYNYDNLEDEYSLSRREIRGLIRHIQEN